jgi:uncharacterized protein YukE
MSARAAELGMGWEQLAETAGLHYETIRALRTGDSRGRPTTRRAVSVALRWTPRSVDNILAGGTPEDAPPSESAPAPGEGADQQAIIAGVRALYPGDSVAEAIMTQWHKPLEQRQRELKAVQRATTGAAEALAHVNRNEEGTIAPFW